MYIYVYVYYTIFVEEYMHTYIHEYEELATVASTFVVFFDVTKISNASMTITTNIR